MNDKSSLEAGAMVRKFLVLDDDKLTGETIRRIGEFAGLESIHTASPAAFFELVDEWSPDVIALDLLMPDMDGVEVMARLSARDCEADLIITSGVGAKVLNAAGLSASGHGLNTLGVLSKPFSPATLRSMLVRSRQGTPKQGGGFKYPSLDQPSVTDLRRAIETRAITVAYQPKIFCKTGTLAGFEALARWSFNGEPVSPDSFIPMAESNGLIDDLTRLVFEQALRWIASLSGSGYGSTSVGLSHVHLSLNISARTLDNESLFRWVVALSDELGIDRHRLIFELTESSAMLDTVTALDTLTRLRMQGFQLSIDDFGTGFSSMVQLVRLPFSEIKIDKSFVMDSLVSAEAKAVTRSIVDLGRSLGLLSTAEGVEDEDTLAYVQSLGCDLAQGYLISRPLEDVDVPAWHCQREEQREAFRLESVRDSALFGSSPERRFDRITRLAKRLFNVPLSLVTFLDRDVEWIKSGTVGPERKIPRSESFCAHTITVDDVLVVPDARADPRFNELKLVRGPTGVRFYAGSPLCLPNGAKIGALCLLDRVSHDLSERELELLRLLAEMAEVELAEDGAYDDELEGVLTKNALHIRTSATLELAKTVKKPVAAILFTLDQLGAINTKFGRSVGDRCLQAVADAIISIADTSDLIGRYRGSEFVLIKMDASLSGAQDLFAKFQKELQEVSAKVAVPVHARLSIAFLEADESASVESAIEEARMSATAVGISLEGNDR